MWEERGCIESEWEEGGCIEREYARVYSEGVWEDVGEDVLMRVSVGGGDGVFRESMGGERR